MPWELNMMSIERFYEDSDAAMNIALASTEHRSVASYERELIRHRHTEYLLREALAKGETLLRQKDDLIEQQELLSQETEHRLLNDLQLIISLLSLQSRASANTETAEQLAIAAHRVSMVVRVHKRLHRHDGVEIVAVKQYIEDICRDFSTMLSTNEGPKSVIVAEVIEVNLPAVTGIPLGFIVNELLTNAIKHGKGRIMVGLEQGPANGYMLSVSNDGSTLPEGFDPAACEGLGMKIIRTFVQQIDGHLQFGLSNENKGTRFSVLFS
jgi:two-component sensor histidine kinase